MNRIHSHFEEINMIAKLADLKDTHYNNTLALSAVIELLVEKGLLTQDEISKKLKELDQLPNPNHPIP